MASTEDTVADTVTLDNAQKLSAVRTDGHLEVETERADNVLIYIDDGTTGNKPAQYTLTHEVYKKGNWRFDHQVTGEQSRSWRVPASGGKWRIDIENTSGTNAQDYRVVLESRREGAN